MTKEQECNVCVWPNESSCAECRKNKRCFVCGAPINTEPDDIMPEERVCDKCSKIYGKCVHCEKPMTKLEAEESEMGNEDWDNLTCDECFDAITLEIAKGAFPMVFADDTELQDG